MGENRWYALFWIAVSVLFALSLWFSASVVATQLSERWAVEQSFEAWLTAAIPIGFVIGAFASAYFGLADRMNPRKLFAISAISGAIFNMLLIFSTIAYVGFFLRVLTGMALAGVYPVAVKMLSQWFPKQRGIAIGILIAALTIGSSLPHIVKLFLSSFRWEFIIACSSVLAVIASAIVICIVKDAPNSTKGSIFSFKLLYKVIKNKPAMLVNYGYFGHNWELYGMWTWLPAFFAASIQIQKTSLTPAFIPLTSFVVIGIAGGIGCIIGGLLSEKIGRSNVTILSMCISGSCAVIIGFTFGKSIWLTTVIAFIWGMSIIADSAQFSTAVSETVEAQYVGTAVTFQMCVGFMVTIASINLIPVLAGFVGWEWVFAFLAIGPLFGIWAMIYYRKYEWSHSL